MGLPGRRETLTGPSQGTDGLVLKRAALHLCAVAGAGDRVLLIEGHRSFHGAERFLPVEGLGEGLTEGGEPHSAGPRRAGGVLARGDGVRC